MDRQAFTTPAGIMDAHVRLEDGVFNLGLSAGVSGKTGVVLIHLGRTMQPLTAAEARRFAADMLKMADYADQLTADPTAPPPEFTR